MRVEVRIRTAIILLIVVAVGVTAGSVAAAQFVGGGETHDHAEDFVTLEGGDELWPYTSQSTTFHDRTLALNLVIYGDTNYTRTILQDPPVSDWREVDEDREDIAPLEEEGIDINESVVHWGGADGADRWIWVNPADGDERWLAESYQLEDGDYLGHRHHIRAYEDPEQQRWTALQAHTEHWDWFHLRHTVHTIEESQLAVEAEFIDQFYVSELTRERFGNDQSSDSDGWVTVIKLNEDLLPLIFGGIFLGVAGVTTTRIQDIHMRLANEPLTSEAIRGLFVVTSIVLAYHTIRFGAIGLERQFPTLNPKIIVAVFYPALVIGMPVVVYLCSRKLQATTAFAAATIGFVGAILIDYTFLGVTNIPLETFVHRAALGVAIGLVAAGASATARHPRMRHGFVRTGVLLWLVAIIIPLLQFL